MRYLNVKEIASVGGADIGYNELYGMWAAVNFSYNCRNESAINALGFASATKESNQWLGSEIGAAGWFVNDSGNTVTWFNNGFFMAFKIS